VEEKTEASPKPSDHCKPRLQNAEGPVRGLRCLVGVPGGDLLSRGMAPHYHRRGAVSRPCSGWEGVGPTRCGRQANRWRGPPSGSPPATGRGGGGLSVCTVCLRAQPFSDFCPLAPKGYRIKPHGPLVPVSSRARTPCTPGLSTGWSFPTLQAGLPCGRSHLGARFPLRCFQRLSLPYLATRRCDWRHNRSTRGTSTPVLSY
jgi:hypothetical protein